MPLSKNMRLSLGSSGCVRIFTVHRRGYYAWLNKDPGPQERTNDELDDKLLVEGYSYMYEENNPAGIKAFMFEQGMIENELRLPLVPVSAPLQAKIHNYLQRYISQ